MKRIISIGIVGFLLASITPNLPAMWTWGTNQEKDEVLENALKASQDQKLVVEMSKDPKQNLLLHFIGELKATHHERLTALEAFEDRIKALEDVDSQGRLTELEDARAENAEARIKALEDVRPDFDRLLEEFRTNHVNALGKTVDELSAKVTQFEIANGAVARIIQNNKAFLAAHSDTEKDRRIAELEREKAERDVKLALLFRLVDETNFHAVIDKLKLDHPAVKEKMPAKEVGRPDERGKVQVEEVD